MKTVAIIPIGGVGLRMNDNKPKQYIKINNKPIFMYTVEKFQKNSNIDDIVISNHLNAGGGEFTYHYII